MRKILALTICTICLSFPYTVQAQENDANVTNQLEEIIGQLENLDAVIQFFVDNQANLQMLVDSDLWNDHLGVALNNMVLRINDILTQVKYRLAPSVGNIEDDVDIIASDVAAIHSDLALFVSQIVSSINDLRYEIYYFQDFLQPYLSDFLTQSDLDQSLEMFLNQLTPLLDNLANIENYSSVLAQILQSIQEMDYSDQVEAALYNISLALDNLQNITVVIDLQEQLDNLDLNLNLDLGSALSRLESDLSSVLDSIEHISYVLQNFVYIFTDLKNDQELTNEDVRDFIDWYQNFFFPGLQQSIIMQNEWLLRQKDREDDEAEYREKRDHFFADDAEFPTGSDAKYEVELVLNEVDLEEPEMPDEKIYNAADSVEADLEEVENELTEGMDLVDTNFKGFLNNMNFRWGSFNPVLSFSFKPPLDHNNYTMQLTYDFSKSELLRPCKAASTGVWGIVLFVSSFLAITETFNELVDN